MIGVVLSGLAAGAATGAGVIAYGLFAPRSALFGPVVHRGPTHDKPTVALTFDDGPDAVDTPRVLDVLADLRVTAAFFMVGKLVERNPTICRQAHDAGHLIANHSFHHHRAGLFHGQRYWHEQLRRTNQTIAACIGQSPAFFRPPMGFKHPPMFAAANQLGLTVVTWSHRALDGQPTTPARITRRLTRPMTGGEVLALHAGPEPSRPRDASATLQALPHIIATLRTRGIQLDRLDRVLNMPGYAPPPP